MLAPRAWPPESRECTDRTSALKPSVFLPVRRSIIFSRPTNAPPHEQDVRRIDLEELLMRVLPPALGWHVGDGSFEDLEERLLHAFTRDVSRDRRGFRPCGK